MNVRCPTITQGILVAGMLSFCTVAFSSQPVSRQDAQSQPDNTKRNRDQASATADQQKMNSSDRELTQKIRKSIIADKSLSTYAHNIKIVAQDGKVTLRGPVRSDEEKMNVEAKAASVAGQGNVTSQIEIAPTK